jgi:serine/threonine protein kinase
MTELAGVMVGNYFLLESLGREGIVETYRARPTTQGGYDVVLRIFRPAFPDMAGFHEHFATEVEKVFRCHHEHIQPLLEYGAGEELLYCATQLIEAETLEHFLRDRASDGSYLPLPLVVQLITQLCSGLHYAHQQGIVHGNIQPSSILLRDGNHVLLTNFSMKHASQEHIPVIAQVAEDNAAYAAPEQGIGMLSPASDIYAVGVLLFQLLTGQLPYQAESPEELALMHSNEPIPSLRALRPDLSESLELVVRVALAKNPTARFPGADALIEALLAAVTGEKPEVISAVSRRIPVRSHRTPLTWKRAFTLITIMMLLSGMIGVLLFFAGIPLHIENLPIFPFQSVPPPVSTQPDPGSTVGITPGITPTATVPSAHKSDQPTQPKGGKPTPGVTATVPTSHNGGPTATPAPVACSSGALLIDGSPNLEPLLSQIQANYMAQCSGMNITLRADGVRALNMVQHGRLDIASSDLSANASRQLTDHPVGALLYSLIASPDVTISNLTSAQVQGIFTGTITNWSQVGGINEPIRIIFPAPNASIQAIFQTFVLNGVSVQAKGYILKRDMPRMLAQLVAQLPGTISYVPLLATYGLNVQVLSINGALPTTQSVVNGSYAFWSIEHLYTKGAGTPQAQSFLGFVANSRQNSTLMQFNVVPIGQLPANILASHLPGPTA